MDKVIELAREAGFEAGDFIWAATKDDINKFYTLARADLEAENERREAAHTENYAGFAESINKLEAENAKLRSCVKEWVAANGPLGWIEELRAENAKLKQVLIDIAYGLEGSRIWGGMEWTYNPLHPFKYLPLRDIARAALGENK